MQDVEPLREEALEVLGVVARRDLRGLGLGAREHLRVELGGGVRAAEVVLAPLPVEFVVEVDVLDVARVEGVFGHIDGGTAAQYIVGHGIPFRSVNLSSVTARAGVPCPQKPIGA